MLFYYVPRYEKAYRHGNKTQQIAFYGNHRSLCPAFFIFEITNKRFKVNQQIFRPDEITFP